MYIRAVKGAVNDKSKTGHLTDEVWTVAISPVRGRRPLKGLFTHLWTESKAIARKNVKKPTCCLLYVYGGWSYRIDTGNKNKNKTKKKKLKNLARIHLLLQLELSDKWTRHIQSNMNHLHASFLSSEFLKFCIQSTQNKKYLQFGRKKKKIRKKCQKNQKNHSTDKMHNPEQGKKKIK